MLYLPTPLVNENMITPLLCFSIATAINVAAFFSDLTEGASATTVQYVTPLINLGIAGVMLWWFMARDAKLEPRLKSIEDKYHQMSLGNQEALDRVARSTLLLVISSGLKPLQEQSQAMISELDKAEEERKRVKEGK